MSTYPPFRARDCALGQAFSIPQTGEQVLVALLNNSTGAHILVVRDWRVSQSDGDSISAFMTRTLPASSVAATPGGFMSPMVTGEAVKAGVMYTGSTSTFPGDDCYLPLGTGTKDAFWGHDFPFAVLLPGWFLVFVDEDNPTHTLGVSLVWQAVEAQYLDEIL